MKQKDVVVTINVRDLKQAFRSAFPSEKVNSLSGPWMSFWSVIMKKGSVVKTEKEVTEPAPATEEL